MERAIIFKFLFPVLFLGANTLTGQQGPPKTKEEYQKMYDSRIQKEVLNGVYIPKDLGDAFAQLNQKIDAGSKQKFKSLPEEEAARKLHFSLGRWMVVNWSFYEGSRFSDYLKKTGITHPDDMAQFVMITYHRYLNQTPLDVKPLVEKFQASRKEELENRTKNGTILHEEKRKREPKDGER